MSEQNKYNGIVDNFLINPRLRTGRHLVLIIALGMIAFNQTFISFGSHHQFPTSSLLVLGLFSTVLYLILIYFNIYILVPRFLLKQKYTLYMLFLSLAIFLFLGVQTGKEFVIYRYIGSEPLRSSYFNMVGVLDTLSNFLLNMVCATGISLTILMKNWMTDSQRVSKLEKKQAQQGVEQLKEQVNPNLLFKILNRTAALSKFEPDKATDMLYRLSQLLRYQLYDCMREKVLLQSVIVFLSNYLELEKLYSEKFEYTITCRGEMMGKFIEPLLFLPFLKEMIEAIYQTDEPGKLEVIFTAHDDRLDFTCGSQNKINITGLNLSTIKNRLDLLYKQNYSLTVCKNQNGDGGIINLQLKWNGSK